MEDNKLPPVQSAQTDDTSNALDITDANVPVSEYSLGQKTYPIESLEVHDPNRASAEKSSAAMPSLLSVPFSRRRAILISIFITLSVLLVAGAVSALIVRRRAADQAESSRTNISTQDVTFSGTGDDSILPGLQGEGEAVLVNGDIVTTGSLKVVSGSFTSVLGVQNLTGNQNISLPNASGVLCVDANNCNYATAGQLAGVQTQVAANTAQLGQIVFPEGVDSINGQNGSITIQGSLNRVNVATAGGVITLSTPQALDANANVQFASLTLGAGGQIIANGLSFSDNGRTFSFPAGGLATQEICTDQGNCGAGGGSVSSLNAMTGAITIQGTTDQINVVSGAGLITLSTPQDIATTSSPTFNSMTLNGDLAVEGGDITSTGTLNVRSTGSNTIVGVGNHTLQLYGSQVFLESQTAGGDVNILSDRDVIVNAADSIELQGTTNVTGDLDVSGLAAIGSSASINTLAGLTVNHTSGVSCVFACAAADFTYTRNVSANLVLGVDTGVVMDASGALATAGLNIKSTSLINGGSTVANYGIRVDNQTAGGSDYGIYVAGADTYALWVDAGATRLDGTLELQALGTTDTATYLCRNSSNQLAACNAAGSGVAYIQGGNSFGQPAILGTNDAQSLAFETGGTTRLTIDTSGNATLTGDLTVTGADVQSSAGLTVTGGTTQGNTLTLRGSSAAWSSATPNIVDISNSRVRFTGQNSITDGNFPVLMTFNDTVSVAGATTWAFPGFDYSPTFTQNTSGGFGGTTAVASSPRLQPTVGGLSDASNFLLAGYTSSVRHALNHSGAAGTTALAVGYADNPFFQRAGGTGTHTITDYAGFQSFIPRVFDDHVMAGYTLANSRGFYARNPEVSGGGAVTNNYGLYVDNLTAGTNDYGIYIQGADSYALWVDGGITRLDGGVELEGASPITLEGVTNDAFETTLAVADPTADNVITLPNATGTVCLTSGNCAGVGGTGDILNNGQNGPIIVGTNDNTSMSLESNNVNRLTINGSGVTTFNPTSADADFVVQGVTDPSAIYVDASTGFVGIGNNPTDGIAAKLHIDGGPGLGTGLIIASSTTTGSEGMGIDFKYGGGSTNLTTFRISRIAPIATPGGGGHIYLQTADCQNCSWETQLAIQNDSHIGIGTTSADGQLEIDADLTQTAWDTNGIQLQSSSGTYTDSSTATSGTATNAVFNSFGQSTLAATNSSVTTTNAATVYIQGAPTAGTNMTITNAYALWVDAGASRFDGQLQTTANTVLGNDTSDTITFTGHVAGDINFVRETAHTIKIADSTTAATPGATLSILGANGNGAVGGAITIQGGTPSSGSFDGGAVTVKGGTSAGLTTGGTLNLQGGDSGFVGGTVNIAGASGAFAGGTVNITGGSSGTAPGNVVLQSSFFVRFDGSVASSTTASSGIAYSLDAGNAGAHGLSVDVQSNSSSQYALNVTSNNGATTGLYVRADGNVGIGTNTPSSALDVNGNFTITSAASGSRVISGRFNNDFTGLSAGTYFENSETNANTYLNIAANGTATTSGIFLHGTSFDNNSYGLIQYTTGTGLDLMAENPLSGGGGSINLITETTGNVSAARMTITQEGVTTFNPTGIDADFSVQGDTNANLFYVDAGNDRVGIGDATPDALFSVGSTSQFQVDTSGNATTTGIFSPRTAEGTDLGSTSLEFDDLYMGDGGGITLGLDSDANIAYDEAGDDRVELTGTGAGLFIEDRLTLGVQAVITDGTAGGQDVTPVSSYMAITVATDGDEINILDSSAKDGDTLIIVNEDPSTTDTVNIDRIAGQIELSADPIALDQCDTLMLIFNGTRDRWMQVSYSNNLC